MYESFYGLSGKPFQLNPDPVFFFSSSQHRRAMSYLEYGLHKNEGFIVITGEIGAGKTTLVRNLLGQLDPSHVTAAHLVSTQLDADDMLRMVAAAFGIPTKKIDKSELLLLLEAYLVSAAQKGKRCLLVIDEAQNLTRRAVEELRMLSNFQLGTQALLQSFLVGQPEFRATLQGPEMEQLRQRVIAACHIGPLGTAETEGYIKHRLTCVGWKGSSPQFNADAYNAIFDKSGGIPRRINSLCDRLLWYGYLADRRTFTLSDVQEIANEMNDESQVPGLKLQQPGNTVMSADTNVLSVNDAEIFMYHSDKNNPKTGFRAYSNLDNDTVGQQLLHIEQGMKRLDATLLRIERSNLVSTALFRKLLDWVKSRESGNGKALD